MKSIQVVYFTDKEIIDIEKSYIKADNPQLTLDEFISANNNQTLIVLRQLKNLNKAVPHLKERGACSQISNVQTTH